MSAQHTAREGGSPRQLDLFGSQPQAKPKPKPKRRRCYSPNSTAAAESVADLTPGLRGVVYAAIVAASSRGLTRHQISTQTGISLYTVTPRCTELLKLGLIVESGTRPSPAGRAAGVLFCKGKEPNPNACTDKEAQ